MFGYLTNTTASYFSLSSPTIFEAGKPRYTSSKPPSLGCESSEFCHISHKPSFLSTTGGVLTFFRILRLVVELEEILHKDGLVLGEIRGDIIKKMPPLCHNELK